MRVAIVGGGEVGGAYAEGACGDHEVVVCTPRPRPQLLDRAGLLGFGVETRPGPWLAGIDRVWVCVGGDVSRQVCDEVVPHLRPGAIVVDLASASAEDKRACAETARAAGVGYVDAVIMGPVPITRAATPVIAAGRDAATAMLEFAGLGAPVRVLPGSEPGDAATLKLLRTVLTKGIEALAVECLVAAERAGMRAELYDTLTDIDATGFTRFLDLLVTSHVQHAQRRSSEVERAAEQLRAMGLSTTMTEAAGDLFSRSATARATGLPSHEATQETSAALAWLADTHAPGEALS
ncbi:MAG: NAD(P)-binding domain-containing protein [Nocardioides sp.]|uniref:NAD(P)-binding domain-containing protein n=1 Tax=Nocardioides sp. TaxID=35761 RepID=UPI0039E5637D